MAMLAFKRKREIPPPGPRIPSFSQPHFRCEHTLPCGTETFDYDVLHTLNNPLVLHSAQKHFDQRIRIISLGFPNWRRCHQPGWYHQSSEPVSLSSTRMISSICAQYDYDFNPTGTYHCDSDLQLERSTASSIAVTWKCNSFALPVLNPSGLWNA